MEHDEQGESEPEGQHEHLVGRTAHPSIGLTTAIEMSGHTLRQL
jgi:hypothetical protein